MPVNYYEDDHISETGALSKLANGLIHLGRFATAALIVTSGMGCLGDAVGVAAWTFAPAADILGVGHGLKAIHSIGRGEVGKGFKQLLRGAAETAFAGYGAPKFINSMFAHASGVAKVVQSVFGSLTL